MVLMLCSFSLFWQTSCPFETSFSRLFPYTLQTLGLLEQWIQSTSEGQLNPNWLGLSFVDNIKIVPTFCSASELTARKLPVSMFNHEFIEI